MSTELLVVHHKDDMSLVGQQLCLCRWIEYYSKASTTAPQTASKDEGLELPRDDDAKWYFLN